MGCPMNPKKLWIFNYEGPCDMKMVYIKASGTKGRYHVTYRCERCDSSEESLFVDAKVLIRAGLDGKKLAEMSFFDALGKHPERLLKEDTDE